MTDYNVTKIRASTTGPDVWEVRLEDGTPYQFVYSASRQGEGWDETVAQAARKAKRNSDYLRAQRA